MAADQETLQITQEVLRCLCICLSMQSTTHPSTLAKAIQGFAEGWIGNPQSKAMLLDLAQGVAEFGKSIRLPGGPGN